MRIALAGTAVVLSALAFAPAELGGIEDAPGFHGSDAQPIDLGSDAPLLPAFHASSTSLAGSPTPDFHGWTSDRANNDGQQRRLLGSERTPIRNHTFSILRSPRPPPGC